MVQGRGQGAQGEDIISAYAVMKSSLADLTWYPGMEATDESGQQLSLGG